MRPADARLAAGRHEVRCTLPFAHGGRCSWAKVKPFEIFGGISIHGIIARAKEGNERGIAWLEHWIATDYATTDEEVDLDPNIHWPALVGLLAEADETDDVAAREALMRARGVAGENRIALRMVARREAVQP